VKDDGGDPFPLRREKPEEFQCPYCGYKLNWRSRGILCFLQKSQLQILQRGRQAWRAEGIRGWVNDWAFKLFVQNV
jgi:hypothetical protein